ncbi:MAG: hypothetical protein JW910_23075 [Anaerolineae bacterium]|nr:hypothetical protein [Anaerolineae bacterium]
MTRPNFDCAIHEATAIMHLEQEHPDAAVAACTDGLAQHPACTELYLLRAAAHDARRDFAAAIADLTTYITRREAGAPPGSARPVASAYSYRAHMHFSRGEFAAAADDYTQAITRSRSPLWSDLYERGQARFHLGDAAGATDDLRAALAELGEAGAARDEIAARLAAWEAADQPPGPHQD